MKAQAPDREVRRGKIEKNHPHLSVRAQCRLLSISRSSFDLKAQGETATNLALMRMNAAIHRFGPPDIMNTDQGSQFTSFVWIDRLKRVGPRILMHEKGRCLDNPRAFPRTNGGNALDMSRLWRSLTYECVYLHAWEPGSQARAGIGRRITFYNHSRPHSAHGGQPPAVVYFNATQTDQQAQAVA